LRQWSTADARAVDAALAATDLDGLAAEPVHTLSGGQRQRVWLALVLAQEPDIMLLDEPTTFLDIRHQLDLLELCGRLHRTGRTLVVVLHDLNLALRYAERIVMMRDGRIAAHGDAASVVTEDMMRLVYDLDCRVMPDPETGSPMVVPRRAR
jgi:iron complex transport system ATP-binding protein